MPAPLAATQGNAHHSRMTPTHLTDEQLRGAALALDPEKIVETIALLRRRIDERFPGSGLGRVCATLLSVGERTRERLDWVARPNVWLRAGTGLMAVLLALGAVAAAWALIQAVRATGIEDPLALVEAVESGIQELVFVALALAFLLTLEGRLKRKRALGFLKELRAVAHLVDMHQLTKDPHRLTVGAPDTTSSPRRELSREELGRYLDYCSEMVSLTSKIAALYAQRFDDAVVLQAVDEVEDLTTGLSGKMWQKITMLDG
ncbi:MAG: hypothetical protein Q8N53_21185 [Longimicrobiales bacterium]|nr:hypothetical protein [Longimicrobiales bacterium]